MKFLDYYTHVSCDGGLFSRKAAHPSIHRGQVEAAIRHRHSIIDRWAVQLMLAD
jgi:hypothetical protein